MASRRRGEGRKKCSFSLRLSCLWEPSQLRFCRMLSLCPARSLGSKASAVCHCVSFVSPTAYVRIPASVLTRAGTCELARSLAWAPWLTHLRRYRRSKNATSQWTRSGPRERNVSGTGRKGGTDRDRARGWRRSTR